jgi:cytoskeletal protein RodZ
VEHPSYKNNLQKDSLTAPSSAVENSPHPKGAILKRAREEQGYSVEVVHEATKIPLDVLRAIEEGYTVRTLSPFYYRGFLKIYAKYLGVDVATVVDVVPSYELRNLGKKIPVEYDWQEAFSRFWTRRRLQQILQLGKIVGVLVVAFLVLRWIGHAFGSWESARKQNPPKATATSKSSGSKSSGKNQSAAPVIPKAFPSPAKNEKITAVVPQRPAKITLSNVTLTVRAKKETWLSVKGDGTTLFQSTLPAGGVETWSANEKIELSGKNISELEFEVNGKTIGTLGRADRRAKKILVTKEGLTVNK